jgi:hypothetical protein
MWGHRNRNVRDLRPLVSRMSPTTAQHLKSEIHFSGNRVNQELTEEKTERPQVIPSKLKYGYAIRQASMANLGVNDNGARRCWFWNLAPPKRFRLSWLYLDRCISLAWTAVRSLVHCSCQGSVRCHTSLDLNMATTSPISHMPSRRGGLRCRRLLVALVARGMAGRSCVHSFRVACVGPSDD